MKTILVTVTDPGGRFVYDVEAPVDLAVEKLKRELAATLNGYDRQLLLSPSEMELFCSRTERLLQNDETLDSAGVWNGDYLILKTVGPHE